MTIRDNKGYIILGSSCIPIIPLLQGGGVLSRSRGVGFRASGCRVEFSVEGSGLRVCRFSFEGVGDAQLAHGLSSGYEE